MKESEAEQLRDFFLESIKRDDEHYILSELQEVLKKNIQYFKLLQASEDSKLVSQIKLCLEESNPFLYADIKENGTLLWTRWEVENVRTPLELSSYPNLATEAPIFLLKSFLNFEFPWELITLHNSKGLYMRIVSNESEYQFVNKDYEMPKPGMDTGFLIWGNGYGELHHRKIWPSDQLPDLNL